MKAFFFGLSHRRRYGRPHQSPCSRAKKRKRTPITDTKARHRMMMMINNIDIGVPAVDQRAAAMATGEAHGTRGRRHGSGNAGAWSKPKPKPNKIHARRSRPGRCCPGPSAGCAAGAAARPAHPSAAATGAAPAQTPVTGAEHARVPSTHTTISVSRSGSRSGRFFCIFFWVGLVRSY